MHCLKLNDDEADRFWTGNRLSDHIAEALRFDNEKLAQAEARRAREHFGIDLAIAELWDADDDD